MIIFLPNDWSASHRRHNRILGYSSSCNERCMAAGPISRILSAGRNRQDGHSSRPRIAARLKRPTRRFDAPSRHVPRANPKTSSLFGLAPCGVYPACRIAATAVRSYRTFSPLPSRFPISSPCGNEISTPAGGMFSVALSVSRA